MIAPAFPVWRARAVAILLLLLASPALAQDDIVDRARSDDSAVGERTLRLSQQSPRALIDNVVIQRLRPEYDAVGVAIGGFRAYPRLSLQAVYDTNIFETPNRQSDAEAIIQPSVSIVSNWERHSLGLDASALIERFAHFSSEDVERYDVSANGVLDFGLGGHLHGLGRIAQDIENRGSIGDLFPGGEPVRYRKDQLTGGVEEHLPGAFFSLDGDYSRFRYSDVLYQGVTFSQAYRDRTETHGTGQVALRIAPRLALFTELSANRERYRFRNSPSDFSSHGESALVGLTFQVPAIISGELGVGYLRQVYDFLPIRPVDGPTFDLSVLWNLTPLFTITGGAHRSIQQTPFLESPSIIESRFSLKFDYELLRNLLLNGEGIVTLDDFGADRRVDRRLNIDFGARFLMRRTLSADLSVGWRRQYAFSNFLRPYQGMSVRVGLTAQR